jgi:predicted kinase
VIVLTGPPGAGKSTVARLLADALPLSVHLHSDGFWHYIRQGRIAPYLPQSHPQNQVVMDALARAAFAYAAGGYDVICDGIVGPWFIDVFRSAAATKVIELHYVILRPDEPTTVRRAVARGDEALTDPEPIRSLYRQFTDLGPTNPTSSTPPTNPRKPPPPPSATPSPRAPTASSVPSLSPPPAPTAPAFSPERHRCSIAAVGATPMVHRRGSAAIGVRRLRRMMCSEVVPAVGIRVSPSIPHARLELGVDPQGQGSAWQAAVMSYLSFSVDAILPCFLVLQRGLARRPAVPRAAKAFVPVLRMR